MSKISIKILLLIIIILLSVIVVILLIDDDQVDISDGLLKYERSKKVEELMKRRSYERYKKRSENRK